MFGKLIKSDIDDAQVRETDDQVFRRLLESPIEIRAEDTFEAVDERAVQVGELLREAHLDTEVIEHEAPRKASLLSRVIVPFRRQRQEQRQASAQNSQERLIAAFSERVQQAFDEVHKEAQEREAILNKKIQEAELARERQIRRMKLLSVPGALIAVLALGYLFYVVRVMETSMTLMSQDVNRMSAYIAEMSTDTRDMSRNMGTLNQNLAHMNGNVGRMTHDVGTMSRSVSPVMGGIRSFFPF